MTTAVLRPNGTLVAADSITGGSASTHAATSDDSDATYVTTDNTNESGSPAVSVDLSTLTLGTSVTKQLRLRMRAQRGGGSDAAFIGEVIYQDDVASVSATAESAFATHTGAHFARTLTQAQIDALHVDFWVLADSINVAEVYVDVVYVTIPVVAVTAVTDPYTASTTVPIAWTNTLDSDGGGQTRYEVKVFTDAQYGAAGFDPDTSTPYYETGEVISAALTVDVGPLENADTYRAYVRVAQTVNGTAHWSAWANDEFTMNVVTSDVDTVTATADNATGSIDVTVARDTATEAWDYIEVQRSIDAGTTWVDVRGATYVAPDSTNSHTVTDYETPNGQSTLYRARATYLSSSLPITGSWVQSTATSWSSNDSWLKAPNDATKNMTFEMAARTPYRRNRRTGVFPVLGAATPVVISDVRSKRTGQIVVETDTAAEAADLVDLLDNAAVILVQHPASMDIDDAYIAVVHDEEMFRSWVADVVARQWSIEYVEVDSPADPDNGR